MKVRVLPVVLCLCLAVFTVSASAEPVTDISEKERCPVCGMFVAKYPQWLAQIQTGNGRTAVFDGIKDMLAYYFEPDKFGGTTSADNLIYVKDYYSQKWINGKAAFFVTGSDVLGPMGHEFIAFQSLEAAESFKKDHQGKMIMPFDKITLETVNMLRSGMKGHSMN